MQFLLMPKPTHNVLVNTTLPNLLNSGNLFAHNLAQTQDHGGGLYLVLWLYNTPKKRQYTCMPSFIPLLWLPSILSKVSIIIWAPSTRDCICMQMAVEYDHMSWTIPWAGDDASMPIQMWQHPTSPQYRFMPQAPNKDEPFIIVIAGAKHTHVHNAPNAPSWMVMISIKRFQIPFIACQPHCDRCIKNTSTPAPNNTTRVAPWINAMMHYYYD